MYVLVSDAWFIFAIADPPNAPFSFIAFKIVSAGQNIVSNYIRKQHLDSLLL